MVGSVIDFIEGLPSYLQQSENGTPNPEHYFEACRLFISAWIIADIPRVSSKYSEV